LSWIPLPHQQWSHPLQRTYYTVQYRWWPVLLLLNKCLLGSLQH
jgi:hypothetical protein